MKIKREITETGSKVTFSGEHQALIVSKGEFRISTEGLDSCENTVAVSEFAFLNVDTDLLLNDPAYQKDFTLATYCMLMQRENPGIIQQNAHLFTNIFAKSKHYNHDDN